MESEIKEETTEWTDELEKQLRYLGECAQGYVRMYKMDILAYSSSQQRWSSSSITAGILSGALLTLSLALGIEKSQVMIIISTFLSFGTSVCHGYLKQVDYASILSDLKRQASKYSGLQNNIKRQLSLSKNKREKASDYHYWITNNYDQLGEVSLNILPTTVEAYRKICLEKNIPFPDEISDDAKVVVHIDKGIDKGIEKGSCDVREPVKRTSTKVGDIIEEFGFTDQHMKYELTRFSEHTAE